MEASRTESYSGDSSYRYIDRLLSEERELMIVSPYIGDSYAPSR